MAAAPFIGAAYLCGGSPLCLFCGCGLYGTQRSDECGRQRRSLWMETDRGSPGREDTEEASQETDKWEVAAGDLCPCCQRPSDPELPGKGTQQEPAGTARSMLIECDSKPSFSGTRSRHAQSLQGKPLLSAIFLLFS